MSAVVWGAILLSFAVAGCASAAEQTKDMGRECKTLRLDAPIKPPLTPTERRMVCGDDPDLGKENEGWLDVPIAQAKFHLKAFLQTRGYFAPVLQEEGAFLRVNPGEKASVRAVQVHGGPGWLDVAKKRDVAGALLTPELLSALEQWAYQELQARGYSCPIVIGRAEPSTGLVVLQVEAGPMARFGQIIEPELPGIAPDVFRRYYAFQTGQEFNGRLLAITRNRILLDRIVEDTSFVPLCPKYPGLIRQEAVAGPPREYTLGASLDTELWGVVDASWRHARIGEEASIVLLNALGSWRRQQFSLSYERFLDPGQPRQSWMPIVKLIHENERPYRTLSETTALLRRLKWDRSDFGGVVEIGPRLEFVQPRKGPGLDSRFVSFAARIIVNSHEHEYFQFSPRQGYSAQAELLLNSAALGSTSSAQRFALQAERLWNYRDFEPPLLVLATRVHAATTWTPERAAGGFAIPGSFLNYLGGISTLRGFGRKEVPSSGIGALTALSGTLELRTQLKRKPIQPLLFVDAGVLGNEPFRIANAFYLSPGFGVHWTTPLGTLRTFFARGLTSGGTDVDKPPSNWQFYLTLGDTT